MYIGCVFENDFHNRNDKDATKTFLLKTIDVLKAHYKLDDSAFRLEIDDEDDYYSIETNSLGEINTISLCDGIWCVSISQKYEFLFFSDLYYLNVLKEIAKTLGAKEMWVCNDLQTWRGRFIIYNRSLSDWFSYLKKEGIDYNNDFPSSSELPSYNQGCLSKYNKVPVFHVSINKDNSL